ncbi:hypothetical protein ABZ747_35425 [Kitasatospora cineracea]|uniref:hypothetical protein n=1 Tax=Kitasatospora cineracea TaxID=88074 RepID=UPI00340E239F
MVRTAPSAADVGLIEYARSHGVEVSARQLERWRGRPDPLLTPNPRGRPGRPGGSTSSTDLTVGELVVWLGRRQRQGSRRDHLVLGAFGEGLPVPEASVRSAFARTVLKPAAEMSTTLGPRAQRQDLDDWLADGADRIATDQQHHVVRVPRRMRAIDQALQQMPALADLWDDMAAHDDDSPGEPLNNAGMAYYGALGVLQGTEGISREVMGRFLRARTGITGPNLGARVLETSGPAMPPALQGPPAHLVPGMPQGSVLHHLYSLAQETPMERLRAAWQAAGAVASWALNLCAAVEEQIATGRVGPAIGQWLKGLLYGIGRDYLTIGLVESEPTPSQQASTTLMLLFTASAFDTGLERATDQNVREVLEFLVSTPVRPLVTGLADP